MVKTKTPKAPEKDNRRKFQRLDADFLLKYEVGGKGSPQITNIKNLSAGGLKFLSKEALPELANVKVELLIPPLEKAFQAMAKILRVRRLRKRLIYSIAVHFENLSAKEQEVLDQFVETVSTDDAVDFSIKKAQIVVQPK